MTAHLRALVTTRVVRAAARAAVLNDDAVGKVKRAARAASALSISARRISIVLTAPTTLQSLLVLA